MKIRVIAPILSDVFNAEILKETALTRAPDTEIEVVNLLKGPASIEGAYDELLAAYHLVGLVKQAESEGVHGVFVDCFGDPGVEAARELVRIPVVGGFQPAALVASLIAGKWSVVTVLKTVVPLIEKLGRKLGIADNIASIRDIDTPVLELSDKKVLEQRLVLTSESAIREDGAEAIVLGCTGMLGLAERVEEILSEKGLSVPVVDPTASAIGYLELLIRSGLTHSLFSYPKPLEKERRF